MVHSHTFRRLVDQHHLDLVTAHVADNSATNAAAKRHVADLIAELVREHRTWADFQASEKYLELWVYSPVFRRAVRENWC